MLNLLATITLLTALHPGQAGQNPPPGTRVGVPAGGAAPAKQARPGPTAPVKKPWQEFKLNPKTTMFLDFTEANPDMIISIFSRTSGITILKDPSFKVPLTVTSAKAVSLDEAFEIFNTVLGLNNYELRKQGNLMLVSRKQPPQPPPMGAPPPQPVPIIKTYPLVNANATQVARVINEVFAPAAGGGAPGGAPQGFPGGVTVIGAGGPPQGMINPGGGPGGASRNQVKASAEDYSNSVVVSALPNDHTTVEALIKDLDKVAVQPLESEMFRLKYVPAEEVLPAVQDVLESNLPTGRGMRRPDNRGGGFDMGFFFNPFGSNTRRNAGGQSATAIKPTNSVIVNATKENIELVRKLLQNLDQPSTYVGTTFVIRLENARATDVADLLTKVFAQRQARQNDSPFFFFSDFMQPQKKETITTDQDENGEIVQVRDLSGKVSINADSNTNSLLIVTQPSNMPMIREVIAKIDRVAEQVMIETVIVEANLDHTTKLGVEWSFLNNKLFNDPTTGGVGTGSFGVRSGPQVLDGLSYTINSATYKLFLNALQSDNKFKVLNTPKIFTSNNVKAEINVSQKLPYITSQQTGPLGNVVSNYQFENVGVVLTVTPRITSSGQVTLDVVQSADDLQGFTSYNAPIINHRQAQTTVSVNDGETIILGGIIRHTVSTTETKVPILGDIPILGNLFKSSKKTSGQTELMVFLTPHIVRSSSDAQRIRKEETEKLSKPSQDGLKKVIPPGGG